MYSIQEIRQKTTENIEKIEKSYKINSDNSYNLEYQNRIQSIKQKVIQSSETVDRKEELDLLLEIIKDVDYLLSFKKEFNDSQDIGQLIIESDLFAIEFGFLYLNYCLDPSNIKNIIEDYINNSLVPLEIISHIFIFRASCLYSTEISKLEEMISCFIQLIRNVDDFSDCITISRYGFKKYQELRIKLSRSLQSIYSCLFILNNIKQEREKNIDKFNTKTKKSRKQKAIEVLDSFVKNGDTQEQKETWEAIKPGLIGNEEAKF